jgi:hypothetical protein
VLQGGFLKDPKDLVKVLDEYASKILTTEEAALVIAWWSETFIDPKPGAVPQPLQHPEP